jgi:hypothetical protein
MRLAFDTFKFIFLFSMGLLSSHAQAPKPFEFHKLTLNVILGFSKHFLICSIHILHVTLATHHIPLCLLASTVNRVDEYL